jgi:hypothetical protein
VTVVWNENGVRYSKPVEKSGILHHIPRSRWPSTRYFALSVCFSLLFVCFATAVYSRYVQEIEVFIFDFIQNRVFNILSLISEPEDVLDERIE